MTDNDRRIDALLRQRLDPQHGRHRHGVAHAAAWLRRLRGQEPRVQSAVVPAASRRPAAR